MLTIRCLDHHWLVLQISDRSRPSDKSGGGGGVIQTQRWGGGGWSPKNIFWPFGPHFGLRISGGGGGGGGGARASLLDLSLQMVQCLSKLL